MKVYIVDAFTKELFKGNQAGVVLLKDEEPFPEESFMKNLAAELKHSETAYVKRTGKKSYAIRYFTPVEEVALCGHATVSSFAVMRDEHLIGTGNYVAETLAGKLDISVEDDLIWMDMAEPKFVCSFPKSEQEELYAAFGLEVPASSKPLVPGVVSTGLRDILLPVCDRNTLNAAVMDLEKVVMLSGKYQVVGIHMYCLGDGAEITAHCRNFAPLYGIPEEAATGTSNGALTYYLRQAGFIGDGNVNCFHQGQAMGRESVIYSVISGEKIRVGGNGMISLRCELY